MSNLFMRYQKEMQMKKIGLVIALAALGTGSVYANDFPVPSFNDAPELYSHGQSSTGAGASGAENRGTAHAAMDYGPWIVIPSSGA